MSTQRAASPNTPPTLSVKTPLRALAIMLAMAGGSAGAEEYRPITGYGNNQRHPELGTAGAQLLRQASGAHYEDGLSAPAGAARPSPRAISNAIFEQKFPIVNPTGLSDFIWTWGQFLDHDLSLTEGARESLPIPIPTGDSFFDPFYTGMRVMPFHRALFDPATGTVNAREQVNEITGFIDGSNVYGSDAARAAWLRSGTGGRLKVSATPVGDLLPFNDGTQPNAGSPEQPDLSSSFFVAGDIRANEQPTLACMHTLFVREHNFQAARISRESPGLSDEEIYQRARKIVIGELQAITYNEFLPALLGHEALGPYRGYKPEVNPGVASVFSAAAYRLGHTLLSPVIQRLGEDGRSIPQGPLALRDSFFNATPPYLINQGIEPFLRGVAAQKAQKLDDKVIDDVRNFLFGAPGSGGLDLISLNLQRGRDHGLPDFNTARRDFGLRKKTKFSEISSDPQRAAALKKLYGDVDDIDLFAGLFVEDSVREGIVGETLQAILVDQFERSRAGDRFWYERTMNGGELEQVRHTRLSEVIRRNTPIRHLQKNVFFVKDHDGDDD